MTSHKVLAERLAQAEQALKLQGEQIAALRAAVAELGADRLERAGMDGRSDVDMAAWHMLEGMFGDKSFLSSRKGGK